MQIKILCVGKLKKNYPLNPLIEFYKARIRTPVHIFEVCAQEPTDTKVLHNMWFKYAAKEDPLFVLDRDGTILSDQDWADMLLAQKERSTKNICLVVGGAHGVPEKTKQSALQTLSLGRITWNHHLMRALLLDVIYRCEKIWENHPYART